MDNLPAHLYQNLMWTRQNAAGKINDFLNYLRFLALLVFLELATKMIVGTIISAGKTVMASEYKDRATVEMGKKVNFVSVFKEQ